MDYVHQRALEGFNTGIDVWTLMQTIELPPELRVGQGYGKVSWAVRTLWESYVGWFRLQSSSELYPDSTGRALAELTALAGADAVLGRAEEALARGEAPLAIRLGEPPWPRNPTQPRPERSCRRPPIPARARRGHQLLGERMATRPTRGWEP